MNSRASDAGKVKARRAATIHAAVGGWRPGLANVKAGPAIILIRHYGSAVLQIYLNVGLTVRECTSGPYTAHHFEIGSGWPCQKNPDIS